MSIKQATNPSLDFEEWPVETRSLLNLDPKDIKKHDLYAILGLGKLRIKATPEQIKLAYERKAAKHHPDNKTAKSNTNDTFYECINKAYEILSDPAQRRLYDSIDYGMTDSQIPKLGKDDDFFATYGAIFEHEARFSNNKDIPDIGNMDSTQEEATKFYDFWYNFDSWRSYDYLDRNEAEGETRDEQIMIEKKNRLERAQKKKEDTMRIQSIIERMQATDPRTKRFKEEKKREKEDKKRAREEAQRLAEEQRKKEEEEERIRKEEEEEAKRKQAIEDKKLKDRQKKVLKKERKAIKALIDERLPTSSDIAEEVQNTELNAIFEPMDLEETVAWKKELEAISKEKTLEKILEKVLALVVAGKVKASTFSQFKVEEPKPEPVKEEVKSDEKSNANDWDTSELSFLIKAMKKYPVGTVNRWQTVADYVVMHSGMAPRSEEEIIAKVADLKKGASLDEDEKSRLQYNKKHNDDQYINDDPTIKYEPASEVKSAPKAAKPVAAKPAVAKPIGPKVVPMAVKISPKPAVAKSVPMTVKMAVKPVAAAKPAATKPVAAKPVAAKPVATKPVATPTPIAAVKPQVAPTPIAVKPATAPAPAAIKPTETTEKAEVKVNESSRPWTSEEQTMLESAMKTYPPSWSGEGERWDNIAAMVEGRTKKECKQRVKALVEMIRAKKNETK
ncbi:hypothetical protein CLU79DRAFT_843068 [Phycomyces nitens]|nr:hypothetical protein CLU79DRAFT_843068 [Phycomyces nitens]